MAHHRYAGLVQVQSGPFFILKMGTKIASDPIAYLPSLTSVCLEQIISRANEHRCINPSNLVQNKFLERIRTFTNRNIRLLNTRS